ncbi:MAG: glycosyltransferase family 2 protein [Pseudomonadota bacterium]
MRATRAVSTVWLSTLFAERASLDLPRRAPHFSAMSALVPGQGILLARIGVIVGLTGIIAPLLFFLSLTGVLFIGFAGLTLWRIALLIVSFTPTGKSTRPLPKPDYLPIYSIMVPLFREAAAVGGLAQSLCQMDWPATRLDLLILMEQDDPDTHAAAEAATWPEGTRLVILPPGRPQTKPRALNFGLQLARGRYVCIYDAEDRPLPGQLKAAFDAFRGAIDPVACVQVPLVAFNRNQSWLAGQWALEYAVQFTRLLPAQARLGLPLLLGGTSNHFDAAILRQLGAWDAWNVTEDADLGVRLARLGYRADMIGVPTLEEAPETMGVWVAQRSRWLKGFLMTWLVMMRRPRTAIQRLGVSGFMTLQAGLMGTVLTSLAHAPLLFWCGASLLAGNMGWVVAGLLVLFAGYGATFLAGLAVPGWAGRPRLSVLLTLPFYWPLHTFAAARAVYGVFHAPAFWAKTPHGLTKATLP